jgi:hypothetical protein
MLSPGTREASDAPIGHSETPLAYAARNPSAESDSLLAPLDPLAPRALLAMRAQLLPRPPLPAIAPVNPSVSSSDETGNSRF